MCDLRPDVLDALGRRFPAVRQTQDIDEMLADESVDAVAVVTPVSTHYDLAMRALDAGKHVFVEKPLGFLVGLAVDLIHAALRARPRVDARPHLPLQPTGHPDS